MFLLLCVPPVGRTQLSHAGEVLQEPVESYLQRGCVRGGHGQRECRARISASPSADESASQGDAGIVGRLEAQKDTGLPAGADLAVIDRFKTNAGLDIAKNVVGS